MDCCSTCGRSAFAVLDDQVVCLRCRQRDDGQLWFLGRQRRPRGYSHDNRSPSPRCQPIAAPVERRGGPH